MNATDPRTETDSRPDSEKVRDAVRDSYARVARGESRGCGCGSSGNDATSCCGTTKSAATPSELWGYTREDLGRVPEGADLGLGCGNPTAIAGLRPGETVLDLGSGAGLDCFLAADRVGATGRVIGVDMTPEMIARARENARRAKIPNVEFRLGEIESLPAADASVDVLISNCVVNLSPDKRRVFGECFRVLRPGGRIVFSDIVATGPIPDSARQDMALWSSCASGALPIPEIETMLASLGFEAVGVTVKQAGHEVVTAMEAAHPLARLLASATIEARKPAA